MSALSFTYEGPISRPSTMHDSSHGGLSRLDVKRRERWGVRLYQV